MKFSYADCESASEAMAWSSVFFVSASTSSSMATTFPPPAFFSIFANLAGPLPDPQSFWCLRALLQAWPQLFRHLHSSPSSRTWPVHCLILSLFGVCEHFFKHGHNFSATCILLHLRELGRSIARVGMRARGLDVWCTWLLEKSVDLLHAIDSLLKDDRHD